MEAIVVILSFGVVWAWIEIYRSKQSLSEQVSALMHRVWTLERELQTLRAAPAAEQAHQPAAEPVSHAAHATPPPPPPVSWQPHVATPPPPPPAMPHVPPPVPVFAAATEQPPFLPVGAVPPPPPVGGPAPPQTTAPPPLEPKPAVPRMGAKDWEALIGGNLLNKAGALLLVIGIMLFLAYYGTQMGPAGRAGCAVLVSLTLLGLGVWLERRETYRVIARSLIGGGWAALYATTYAIYALPAARIIDNAFVGSMLTLLVAGGMIAHSLRYHSQAVTAVAFFSAFAALAVTPSTPFAVLSLIPLAAAVLFLAWRFSWYNMALMGVLTTYGACAWRGSSDAPLIQAETLFLAYWVLFEIFDLMRFAKRVRGWAVELIFPLNAAGFLGLSYVSWTSKSAQNLWILSAIAATIYLVSTLWRLKIELDGRFAESEDLASRVRSGSYEAPLAVGAFLTAAAIVQKLTGMWMSTALALEAQALFAVGIRFRATFLRALAVLGFLVSLAHIADDARDPLLINVLGHMTHAWVFAVLFHALLFYANRAMSGSQSNIGLGFSWGASLLVAVTIANESPDYLIGTGLMVLSAILFEFGNARSLREFRHQGYLIGFAGAGHSLCFLNKPPIPTPWFPRAFGAAFTYAAALRASLLEKRDASSREWPLVEWVACAYVAMFSVVLVIKQVPDEYAGAWLWGLALVLLELGLQRWPARIRVFSYLAAPLAALATLSQASTRLVKFASPEVWGPYAIAAAAAWIMSTRLTMTSPDNATQAERTVVRSFLSGVGFLFAMIACWVLTPDEFVPAAWAALGLAVFEAGNLLEVRDYRLQAQVIAVIAALSSFALTLVESHPHRILAMALLIAVFIGFRLLSPARGGFEDKLPVAHELAATILAAALIYQEVSGGLLTVAWGTEALVLLGAGFAFRERALRLQGLGMFLICVLKLFLYDLRNLETPYRILSFIALGLILLGVSWIYTRFREQLQKLL